MSPSNNQSSMGGSRSPRRDHQGQTAEAAKRSMHEEQHRSDRSIQQLTASSPLVAAVLQAYQQRHLLGPCKPSDIAPEAVKTIPDSLEERGAVSHSDTHSTKVAVRLTSSPLPSGNVGLPLTCTAPSSSVSNLSEKSSKGITGTSNKSTIRALQLSASIEAQSCVEQLRPEDILKRTRATMIPKPRKKPRQCAEDKRGSIPRTESPAPQCRAPDREIRHVQAFPLPVIKDERPRSTMASLRSYRALWNAMGGIANKEKFLRRVQNGTVYIPPKRAPTLPGRKISLDREGPHRA